MQTYIGPYTGFDSLAAAAVLWASGRKMPVQVRFGAQPGEVDLEADVTASPQSHILQKISYPSH